MSRLGQQGQGDLVLQMGQGRTHELERGQGWCLVWYHSMFPGWTGFHGDAGWPHKQCCTGQSWLNLLWKTYLCKCSYIIIINFHIFCPQADSLHIGHVWFWMSDHTLLQCMFFIHGSGVLIALFGCCMAGATWNCCHLGASSVYTIQPCTSLQYHFIQSHIGRVCVFSCNLPPALLAEWPGSFMCYCGNTGVEWIPT